MRDEYSKVRDEYSKAGGDGVRHIPVVWSGEVPLVGGRSTEVAAEGDLRVAAKSACADWGGRRRVGFLRWCAWSKVLRVRGCCIVGEALAHDVDVEDDAVGGADAGADGDDVVQPGVVRCAGFEGGGGAEVVGGGVDRFALREAGEDFGRAVAEAAIADVDQRAVAGAEGVAGVEEGGR